MARKISSRNWIWSGTLRTGSVALALTVIVAPVVVTPPAVAQNFSFRVLHNFTGTDEDGTGPSGSLIQDAASNLYGTTIFGGPYNAGTVFVVNGSGYEKVLHSFGAFPDGANPYGGMILDAAGNLYGTTSGGGAFGVGTVFVINSEGQEKVLYSFAGSPDGANPFGNLVQDATGNLYGTTWDGGTSNFGTVFVVDRAGREKVLYSFTDGGDGGFVYAGLILDSTGNLYGTTLGGGANYVGTVFEANRTGKEKVLYSFTVDDGANPYGGVIRDAGGNLYGTTDGGGVFHCGTVFAVSSTGKETVLHSFVGNLDDGGFPRAGLVQDAIGNLYGTTYFGGAFLAGTVFMVSSAGGEEVLHSFTGTDGSSPIASLVRDAAGNLYGTASGGGLFGLGTVFELSPQ
jgi:uncharacterized repeat protein (TIGR03803 family)